MNLFIKIIRVLSKSNFFHSHNTTTHHHIALTDSKGLCRDPKYTFKCNETFCLLPYQVCDGKIDCEDGTDEANCSKLYFK